MPDKPAPSTARVLLPLTLVVLLLAAYLNALGNPFLIDDASIVVEHPHVNSAAGLTQLWTSDYWAGLGEDPNLYRPLTILSLNLNSLVTGYEPNPLAFRLVNILLLAVLAWVIKLYVSEFAHYGVGWLAGLLVAMHPANTELVDYIVGRSDLLAMIGILGFAYNQKRAYRADTWTAKRVIGAAGCALLALGAKETGLAVIPVAVAQMWLFGARRAAAMHITAILLVALPAAVYLLGRVEAVGWTVSYAGGSDDLTGNPLRDVDHADRVPAAAAIAWFYFKQIFITDTSFNHIPETLATWTSGSALVGALGLVVVTCATVMTLVRRIWLAVPLVISVVQYVLVGNLFVASGVYAANRLMLPFLLAAACVLAVIIERFTKGSRRRRAVATIPVGAMMVWFGFTVVYTNFAWQSQLHRMQADAERHPTSPVACYWYGIALHDAGDHVSAIDWLRQAVKRAPESIQARQSLINVYNHKAVKNWTGIRDQASAILERYPQNFDALRALGVACMHLGDPHGAHTHLMLAQQIRPHDREVASNLAKLEHELNPTTAEGLINRLMLEIEAGRLDEARRLSERLLEMQPDSFIARRYLGAIALQRNDLAAAERHLRRAEALDPDHPEVQDNLAVIEINTGRFHEATTRLERLLQKHPDFAPAQQHYEALRRHLDTTPPR